MDSVGLLRLPDAGATSKAYDETANMNMTRRRSGVATRF